MTHFKAFFNKPSRATDIDDQFLSDFPVFSGEDVVSLNSEFSVVELREVVQGMCQSAAVGAFGLELSVIKILLDSDVFGPMLQ